MTLLKSLILAAALAMPVAASAAPVPVYSASGSALFDGQFFDFFADPMADIDVAFTGELVGSTLTGSLLVSDASGTLVESMSIVDSMFDLQPGPDTVTVLFDALTGPAAMQFGDLLTAVFSFTLEDGDNGGFEPVGVTLFAEAPAPIPLPASLGLLVLGVGALAGVARRRV